MESDKDEDRNGKDAVAILLYLLVIYLEVGRLVRGEALTFRGILISGALAVFSIILITRTENIYVRILAVIYILITLFSLFIQIIL